MVAESNDKISLNGELSTQNSVTDATTTNSNESALGIVGGGGTKNLAVKNHPSTPMMNSKPSANNLTVTRKTRTRQQTITVESQVSKEVNAAFDEVQQISDLSNPVEELRRRMQRLFSEKEKEYIYKLSETEKNREEELALTKIKFSIALKTISTADEFLKHYKTPSENGGSPIQNGRSVLSPVSNGAVGSSSSVTAPGTGPRSHHSLSTPGPERAITPDVYADLLKERNLLRDELRELENSYSDLFKRYEKMRENCVLLKNAEETMKKNAEDDAAKYEKLAAMYAELRNTAANELNKANDEIVRLERQHEENTLNLRCRLKRNESEINSMTMTIQGKNNQIEELNKLCDDLMRKNGVIDEEEMASVADSYDEYN